MLLIKLSKGKQINIEGLEMTEKQFNDFFRKIKPWKEMHEPERTNALKKDFKIYKSNSKKQPDKVIKPSLDKE